MVQRKEINGKTIEAYNLTESEFNAAVKMVSEGKIDGEFESLISAKNYVNFWLEDEMLDSNYRKWLKEKVESGAEIFTYMEGWQAINEIAVW